MKPQGVIRLMLVDDHFLLRQGLQLVLSLKPDLKVVAEAENGRNAIELFRKHHPDITLMDLRLPDMTGTDALRAIRKEFPNARIVMLTTYDADEDIHRALGAGAAGYLLKNIPAEELVEAIRMVQSGKTCIPAAVAKRLAERDIYKELTARELEVLQLVVKGLSNKEIADVLQVTPFTAKAHVRNILSKLDVADRTEAATLAISRGLVEHH
jgi:two-component system NarL family response regulator